MHAHAYKPSSSPMRSSFQVQQRSINLIHPPAGTPPKSLAQEFPSSSASKNTDLPSQENDQQYSTLPKWDAASAQMERCAGCGRQREEAGQKAQSFPDDQSNPSKWLTEPSSQEKKQTGSGV
ncbi:hypothetical protein C0J50_14002 [Silurus asotus]|uniref:Uncharacterized protein n=1 Tax=Silurus asotus TaxID=30991 RepID=A0AAD5FRW4_SILAS|nr:hypothetical protein C0J50_14002 [Silurus asotus]